MPFKCMGESGKAFDHHGVASFYQNIVPRNLNGATRIQLKIAAWTVFPGLDGSPDLKILRLPRSHLYRASLHSGVDELQADLTDA